MTESINSSRGVYIATLLPKLRQRLELLQKQSQSIFDLALKKQTPGLLALKSCCNKLANAIN